MESVEDMAELVGGDRLALVADGNVGFPGLGRDLEGQLPLGEGEFYGVVQQVVADLRHRVRVAPDHHGAVGQLGLYVQIFFCNFGFQADQDPDEQFRRVELLLRRHSFRGLQAGQLQHPPHQAGEPAGLRRDDLQGLPFLFRRDGAV